MIIAEVVIAENSTALDKIFHYYAPEDILVGSRVLVPFGGGNTTKEGIVVGVAKDSPYEKLKTVKSVLDEKPLITEELLKLAFWLKERYLSTYYQAIKTIMPSGITIKNNKFYILNDDVDIEKTAGRSSYKKLLLERMKSADGCLEKNDILDIPSNIIKSLVEQNIIAVKEKISQNVNKKYIRMVSLAINYDDIDMILFSKKAPKQAQVLDILNQVGSLSAADLINFTGGSYSTLKSLKEKGYIDFEDRIVLRESYKSEDYKVNTPPILTEEQKVSINKISENFGKPSVILLRGVTGSGKTEVYLQIITKILEMGKEAILLVPEISLTPQTVSRFVGRFGKNVSVLHSGLSMGERYDEWQRIRNGDVTVAIGARSAIFAPFENLGVIILDEEHEATYKSENSPHYHAKDVAIWRGKYNNAITILGSATPSVDSYYFAKRGTYQLIEMENRYNFSKMPKTTIVDMKHELKEGNKSVFSTLLAEEIYKNIQNRQQTIIFHNRRGYNSFILCRSCGEVIKCKNCDVPMTYHMNTGALICHYCGYRNYTPQQCPTCYSPYIRYVGTGTQKIEEEVKQLFPEATYLRMDADTTTGKNSHEQILKRFSEEKIDILIGTQMVTKGLDFPNVTLVGVLSADVLLNMDDYRANERTFSLLTQVCGRAGRGDIEGRAIIQTYNPDNDVIEMARAQEYKSFYESEIVVRRQLVFPPYCQIVQIVVSGEDEKEVAKDINEISLEFRQMVNLRNYRILGPVPSPYSKIKNKYRYRMIIKCRSIEENLKYFHTLLENHYKNRSTHLFIDTNPYNFS